MRITIPERLAALLLAAEGLGLLIVVGGELTALVSGESGSLPTAVALLVLSAIGAAAVLAFAVAVWRGASWGRSGGIVAQLLILSIALGMLTGLGADPGIALALALPAVVILVLLVLAARAAAARATD